MAEKNAGLFAQGILKGFFETVNGEYTNRTLALVVGDTSNKYGESEDLVFDIDVSPKIAGEVKSFCENHKGLAVRAGIWYQERHGVKNGRAWGFVRFYLRDATDLQVVPSKPALKEAK